MRWQRTKHIVNKRVLFERGIILYLISLEWLSKFWQCLQFQMVGSWIINTCMMRTPFTKNMYQFHFHFYWFLICLHMGICLSLSFFFHFVSIPFLWQDLKDKFMSKKKSLLSPYIPQSHYSSILSLNCITHLKSALVFPCSLLIL